LFHGLPALKEIRKAVFHLADVIVSVAAEARRVVQVGPLPQKASQHHRILRNLAVDFGEIAARASSLRDLLWAPERSCAKDKLEKSLQRAGMLVEFAV